MAESIRHIQAFDFSNVNFLTLNVGHHCYRSMLTLQNMQQWSANISKTVESIHGMAPSIRGIEFNGYDSHPNGISRFEQQYLALFNQLFIPMVRLAKAHFVTWCSNHFSRIESDITNSHVGKLVNVRLFGSKSGRRL